MSFGSDGAAIPRIPLQQYVRSQFGSIIRCALVTATATALLSRPAIGQSNVEHQSLYWFGYFGTIDLNAKWYTVGEFQERRWTDPIRVHQRIWRGHLHRRMTPSLSLGAGFTYFQQGVQFPEAPALPLVGELRPHLQLDARQWLTPRLTMVQRARLEYRAIPRTEEGRVVGGYKSAGRARYRMGVEFRPWDSAASAPWLKVSDEVHVMFGDRPLSKLFDQNRLQAGVGIPLNKSLSLEVGYLWWYQHRYQTGKFDRDIWRLEIHHRIRRVTR